MLSALWKDIIWHFKERRSFWSIQNKGGKERLSDPEKLLLLGMI